MSEVLTGTILDGRYAVEEKLGQGGMASVYRVRHLRAGFHLALKALTLPTAAIRGRPPQEGGIQGSLGYPDVVMVVDVADVDVQPSSSICLAEARRLRRGALGRARQPSPRVR